MIKGVTHAHLGPIWYHCPIFPKPVSWLELFLPLLTARQDEADKCQVGEIMSIFVHFQGKLSTVLNVDSGSNKGKTVSNKILKLHFLKIFNFLYALTTKGVLAVIITKEWKILKTQV